MRDGDAEDFVSAPASYEALFVQYYDFVVGLVRKLGIDDQRKEDVACEILLRFYERDFLTEFDPDLEFTRAGQRKKARFKSFLSAFVASYVQGHRERHQTISRREPLVCDRPVGEGESTWLDVFGPANVDDYSSVEEAELVTTIRAYLVLVPRRSKYDRCDLPKLFDVVVAQIRDFGSIDVPAVQAVFGISNTAVHSWLGELRKHVRVVVEEHAEAYNQA